jgi:hypothetical protein
VKGQANANILLDTRRYKIEVPHGSSEEYTANIIAENLYAQCDAEGYQYNLMGNIIDHKMDGHDIDRADMYIKHGSNTKLEIQSRVGTFALNGKTEQQAGNA